MKKLLTILMVITLITTTSAFAQRVIRAGSATDTKVLEGVVKEARRTGKEEWTT